MHAHSKRDQKKRRRNKMPSLEEHCKHTGKRYGVEGRDINSWMDEPSQVAGGAHREFRHDLESLPIAIRIFESKYGAEMVENIFLDHLRADSKEMRKREENKEENKVWPDEEDRFLLEHFLEKVEVLEQYFHGKYTRKDIRQRQKYLGIIRPRIFRYKEARLFKIGFRLKYGQSLSMHIEVLEGGNRDIDFCIGKSKRIGKRFSFQTGMIRITGERPEFRYTARFTGVHWFNFSNLFSWLTTKKVVFFFHLEGGKPFSLRFQV